MSQQTTTKQSDILNTQENVENNHNKNYPLITNEPIPNTPFRIVNKENKYYLVIGRHLLSDPLDSIDDVMLQLINNQWEIILRTIIAVIQIDKELTQEKLQQALQHMSNQTEQEKP